MNKRIITILAFTACSFFSVAHAALAEELSVGVYPPITALETMPGDTLETPITLENFGNQPITLSLSYKEFHASDREDGSIVYVDGSEALRQALRFIGVYDGDQPVATLTLAAKEKKTFTLRISVPENHTNSDIAFSLLFSTIPEARRSDSEETSQDSYTLLSAGIASNVLLSIGNRENTSFIESFSAPVYLEHGPVPFNARIKNAGQQRIEAKGSIRITNMFGQHVGDVQLTPMRILPQSIRKFTLAHAEAKTYPQDGDLIWSEKILLGWYTANIEVTTQPGNNIVTRSIHFFVFPLRAFVGVFVITLSLLIIHARVSRKLNQV